MPKLGRRLRPADLVLDSLRPLPPGRSTIFSAVREGSALRITDVVWHTPMEVFVVRGLRIGGREQFVLGKDGVVPAAMFKPFSGVRIEFDIVQVGQRVELDVENAGPEAAGVKVGIWGDSA